MFKHGAHAPTTLVAFLLILAQLIVPITAAAQETSEPTGAPFLVGGYVCPQDPVGAVSIIYGTVPPECYPASGLHVTVNIPGYDPASCYIGEAGHCEVTIPGSADLWITADPNSRPDLPAPLVPDIYLHSSALEASFVYVVPPVVEPAPPTTDPVVEEPVIVDVPTEENVVVDSPTDVPVTEEPVTEEPATETPTVPEETALPNTPDTSIDEPIATEDTTIPGTPAPSTEEPGATEPSEVPGTPDIATEDDVTPATPTAIATAPVDGVGTPVAAGTPTAAATPGVASPAASPQARPSNLRTARTLRAALLPATGQEMVTATSLACYPTADTTGTPIVSFAKGTLVSVTGSVASGWLPVQCSGLNGFVQADGTTAVPSAPRPVVSQELVVPSGVVCRTAPTESSAMITVFRANALVSITDAGAYRGWLPVICGGQNGWILATSTSLAGREALPTKSIEMATTSVACYSAPSTSAHQITTIAANSLVVLTDGPSYTGWLSVRCGGHNGFVLATSTTLAGRPALPTRSVEMTTNSVACRTAPSTLSHVITTIPANSLVTFTSGPAVSGWVSVRCGGHNGWVQASATTITARAALPMRSVEMTVASVACRNSPSTLSNVITTIPANSLVTFTSGPAVSGWVSVRCGGHNGWIQAQTTTIAGRALLPVHSTEMATRSVVCYTAPSTLSHKITTIPAGSLITRTKAPTASGWLPVRCGGHNGYVSIYNTTIAGRAALPEKSVEMTTASVACHTAPHATSHKLTTLSAGTLISVTGAPGYNGWLPVLCNGANGFVQLNQTTSGTSTPLKASTGSTTIFNTGKEGTVCRTAPSTKATAIMTLYEGNKVTVTGAASDGWIPVQCNGKNGFIAAGHTTTGQPVSGPTTEKRPAIVTGTGGGGLRCRTAPVDGALITILPDGSPVDVMSETNGWALINCGGGRGYVSMQYLTFNLQAPSGGGEVWMDVNLTTQYAIFYQGNRIIGQTYVSTGRWPTYETPTGTFYINSKYVVQDMAGCSGGECWYVPSVPHAQYFTYYGHAIHGAYWHNDFGVRRSHGCINLPVGIAEWWFNLTVIGTRVYIHY